MYGLNKPNLYLISERVKTPDSKMAILEEVDDAAPNYYQVPVPYLLV
jgi:hypothetical protein